MIKVFEDFDITIVGYYQSILESNGIDTFMKNQFGTTGAGELPFLEVVPQLWVLNEADAERALELISKMSEPKEEENLEEWDCPNCHTHQEATFTHCWKCSTAKLG